MRADEVPITGQWKEQLERILKSSQNCDPAKLMEDLRDLGAVMGDASAEVLLKDNPHLFEYGPALKQARNEMVSSNEISLAREILRQDRNGPTSFPKIANSISLRFYNRSNHMFSDLDFSDCRRMVLVGCGWVPLILFRVQDEFPDCELIGLDIVPDAVETANTVARHLGYKNIRAELQNGHSYDYSEAQIVYVVSMVESKSAILSRIADTAPDTIQILVNEPKALARLWQDVIEASLDPRLEIFGRRSGEPNVQTRDLYLRRRPDALSPTVQNGQPDK